MRSPIRQPVCSFWIMTMIAASLSVSAPAAEYDWPAWRGPNRDGVSKETRWKAQFGDAGPKVAWEKQVGLGYGAVSVSSGRAFVYGHDLKTKQDVIRCYNVEDGRELWRYDYGAELYDKLHKGGPGATPTLDGDVVFTISKGGQLFCLRADKGEKIWFKNVIREYSVKPREWGFSGSPLVIGDHLIVDVGVIAAINKHTGQTIWKTQDYTEGKNGGYASPILVTMRNRKMIAVFPEFGLVLLDPDSGKQIASHPWKTSYGVNAATPVIIDEDRIFISSGYNTGCAMLKLTDAGLQLLWENKNMRNKMASCVLVGGHLYGFDEGRLRCLDPNTGQVLWTKRGTGHGALTAADGKLIAVSEKGAFFTAHAKSDNYHKISSFQLFKQEDCWIAPVLSNGRIYCRSSAGRLVCFDMRE